MPGIEGFIIGNSVFIQPVLACYITNTRKAITIYSIYTRSYFTVGVIVFTDAAKITTDTYFNPQAFDEFIFGKNSSNSAEAQVEIIYLTCKCNRVIDRVQWSAGKRITAIRLINRLKRIKSQCSVSDTGYRLIIIHNIIAGIAESYTVSYFQFIGQP